MQPDMPEGISRSQALQALASRLFGAHANSGNTQSFEFIERMYQAYLANLQAMMAYQCGAAGVSAALLLPADSNDTVPHWRDRVDNLEVVDLQGDHYSILNDENAAQIATVTAAYLDQPTFIEQRAHAGGQP
jgi:thioesterase domain-containing protein